MHAEKQTMSHSHACKRDQNTQDESKTTRRHTQSHAQTKLREHWQKREDTSQAHPDSNAEEENDQKTRHHKIQNRKTRAEELKVKYGHASRKQSSNQHRFRAPHTCTLTLRGKHKTSELQSQESHHGTYNTPFQHSSILVPTTHKRETTEPGTLSHKAYQRSKSLSITHTQWCNMQRHRTATA